jgi:signal peptidase I
MSFDLIFLLTTAITATAWTYNKLIFAKKNRPIKPWWVRHLAGNFFIVLGVFVFRSFLFESFFIPSGSMLPTLVLSDYIAVQKFSYSLRLPVLDTKIIDLYAPERGDIIVFKHPITPNIDFIKRIIGKPGDQVFYLDKKLTINGKEIPNSKEWEYKNLDKDYVSHVHTENIFGAKFNVLNDHDSSPAVANPSEFKDKNNCQYLSNGFICKVPDKSYFVMGDNRDNSQDSRFWGFVPEQNIKGKAVYIWINPLDLSRTGLIK